MAYAKVHEIASCAAASAQGGLDFIALSADFRLRAAAFAGSGHSDAAEFGTRLLGGGYAGGASVGVDATPEAIQGAAYKLAGMAHGVVALEIRVDRFTKLDQLVDAIAYAHAHAVAITACVHADEFFTLNVPKLTALVDVIRLRTTDQRRAREVCAEVHAAAGERTVRVLLEVGVTISATRRSAIERARLIESMTGQRPFSTQIACVGTVYDAADTAERLVGNGCADGIVFLPASVQTDLASLIRGVLPLLRARAALEDEDAQA